MDDRKLSPSRVLYQVRHLIKNDQLVISVVAVAVGLLIGGAVVLFRHGIDFVQKLYYGAEAEHLLSALFDLPHWALFVLPLTGGVLVSLYYRFIMPGGAPLAVAQVIEAAALKDARMDLKQGIGAALGSVLSLGVGGSVGREGPAVHLGASLSAWVAEKLRFRKHLSRSLLGCGVAAAVAASFNAPIAGALFAHEVVVGHYALTAFAPVVMASVTATLVSRAVFGDYPAFIIPDIYLSSLFEGPGFVLLGVLGGLTAIGLMRGITGVEALHGKFKTPKVLRPIAGGAALGIIALAFPQVLGVGYEMTDSALKGALPLLLVIALLIAKLAATSACLGSGWGGGVFSPSLALGAVLGSAFELASQLVFPVEILSSMGVYALVGMGAVASAVLGAPISTTLIVFELTGDYGVTIAVMVAVVVATIVVHQIEGTQSFFHWQLERRGLNPRFGQEVGLLQTMRVLEVMAPPSEIGESAPLNRVREALQKARHGELFVTAADGSLRGTITLADMDEAAFDHDLDTLVIACDLCRDNPPFLQSRDPLDKALKLMLETGEEHIAVVDHAETMRLIGCVHETEALLAYNRTLFRAKAEERGERDQSSSLPF